MRPNVDVVAIVVNHHTSRYLPVVAECLANSGIKRTIVIDNSECEFELSTASEIFETVPGSMVLSINNKGFADAVHRAIDASESRSEDVLWIINPDVRFPPETPSLLLHHLQTGAAKVVSPVITTGDGKPWFYGGDLDLKRGRPHHLVDPRLRDATTISSFITGTAMMMTRQVWDITGGFPTDLFMYWEDVDFCLRCRDLGLPMTTVGRAVLWHEVGGSGAEGGFSELFYFYYQRNRLWVSGRGRGLAGRLRLTFTRESAKWLIYPLLRERRNRLRKAVASVRGVATGLKGRRV